jgi:putative DNA primase/helicase
VISLETLITSKFPKHKQAGGGYVVHCPVHPDDKPSLSIGVSKETGAIVMFCHAGCSTKDIVDAIGLKFSDLSPDTKKSNVVPSIVCTYDYRNVAGELVYQVVRKSDKTFLQRRPDPMKPGGWIWKTGKSVKRVPYRLPDLLGKATIYVVEGEKDADNLHAIGIPATCNAGGAGKWGVSESKALKLAGCTRVIILPDNDGPGVAHANEVAARCKGQGLAVTIAQLPDLPPKGDVSDWLASGKTKNDLEAFVKSIPYVVAPPAHLSTVEKPSADPSLTHDPDEDPDAPPLDLPPDTLKHPTKYAPANSDGIPHDVGAAEAFSDRYGDRVRFDHAQQRWLIWDGHYWKPDDDGKVKRFAKRHADLWQQEAFRAVTYPSRLNLVKFTMNLDKEARLAAMLNCATWQEPITTNGEQWDRDPWVLGVANGVVDLKTGELREGKREDFITKQAGASYESSDCPRWLTVLDEVMDGDQDMVGFIRRAIGYSLTGDMREQVFFMCIGAGANGKSIFLDTLEYVLGDYGHRANMRIFVSGASDTEKFHLAELDGRRMILASETKPNTRMNEHVVKNWTGGESQSAERKFGAPFTFKPVGKLWLGTNHNPRVIDDSYGFWRRVRTIEFNRTFKGADEDPELRDKLRAEAAGILSWAVQGCLEWQEVGLLTPQRILDAVADYQEQEDPVREFLIERCDTSDPESRCLFKDLFAAYNKWGDDMTIPPRERLTRRAFGNYLKRQFGTSDIDGQRRYRGIELKAQHLGDVGKLNYANSDTND